MSDGSPTPVTSPRERRAREEGASHAPDAAAAEVRLAGPVVAPPTPTPPPLQPHPRPGPPPPPPPRTPLQQSPAERASGEVERAGPDDDPGHELDDDREDE